MSEERGRGQPSEWSEAALLRLISDSRAATGACSFSTLARIIGVSRQAVFERMVGMRERGLVTWNEHVFGSLRTTDEQIYRSPRPAASTRTKDHPA